MRGEPNRTRCVVAKKDVSSIEKGAGYFLGFITTLMNVARQKVVPFEAIYRLGTEGGYATVVKIVDVAYTDWQAEQPKPVEQQPEGGHPYRGGPTNGNALPPNHYRVRVNRGPLPPMATLEEMYSKNGVSALYNGSYTWAKDRSRTGENDVTADEVVMVAKQFTVEEIREMGGLTSENIIAWGIRNNLVAADEKETHAFGINPETCDLQRSRWLVGLGSSTVCDDGHGVAVLGSGSDRRFLGDDWFGDEWSSGDRDLFVRK